jgi:hypothetical protein
MAHVEVPDGVPGIRALLAGVGTGHRHLRARQHCVRAGGTCRHASDDKFVLIGGSTLFGQAAGRLLRPGIRYRSRSSSPSSS